MITVITLLEVIPAVAIADTLPPALTITPFANGTFIPASGTSFTGSASDADGVQRVRIYVYDEARAA
ncbi:MAG: hypothetical protein HY598_03080, partial [Candidatus Omnitrophica bacterium]|nr:hypothetical protein [Candidatus Omnitrophota bacterium]